MNLLLKRHYLVLVLLVVVLGVIVICLGDQRVVAYTTQAVSTGTSQPSLEGIDYQNEVALFDDSVVHSIQVILSDEDYDQMISTYQETGLKEYVQADIIMDGVRVNDVGIRLKGNASLQSALGGRMGGMQPGEDRRGFGGMPGGGEGPVMPAEGQLPELPADGQLPERPSNGQRPEMPEGFQPSIDGQGFPGGQPGFSQASSGEVKIPFQVKFDEYVSGQTYQGYERIAIRTYGISPDEAMLAEPVTNDMARLAGLPATQTTFTGFRFNDEAEQLYVVSEIIDEDYLAKYFDNPDGVLYKAEVGSTLSYQGDDPSSYANDFSQETRVNDADLAPLITFMRFLDQSDDASFERELPDYLDVESFATYLALNALLVNTDSMIGMNNNYYLYYDEAAERFTLLMWDANESLGGLGGLNSVSYDLSLTGDQGFRGPGGGENALVKRFLANDTFRAMYEQKLAEVYGKIFVSGAIGEDVERYSSLIHSVNEAHSLVEIEAYDQAVQNLLDFVMRRMEYLESTDLLGQ